MKHLKKSLTPPSWTLKSKGVQLAVTELGGHLGSVTFSCKGKKIRPFYVSPFWKQKTDPKLPPVLKVLRGDFFCLPFGGNAGVYRGESHPPHGESANSRWKFISNKTSDNCHILNLELPLRVRAGCIRKKIILRDNEQVIYQEHLIQGMKGPNCPGHHPTLEFRSQGHIALSPFLWGSTYPWLLEAPESKSYCGLKPGVEFRSLGKVPLIYGGMSDLSIYPARVGHTDVIQIVANPKLPVAWNTVTFPDEGWLYFALRDPKVLRQTVMWFCNGGRHGPPWNGNPLNVLGLEDVTAYYGEGLPISAQANSLTKRDSPTALNFNPRKATSIRYIMGVAPVPKDFKVVKDIEFQENQIVFHGNRGHAAARVNWKFLSLEKES